MAYRDLLPREIRHGIYAFRVAKENTGEIAVQVSEQRRSAGITCVTCGLGFQQHASQQCSS